MRDDDPIIEPSWRPQPGPQERFINATEFEVVYGSARGGGKTDAALGDFAWHAARYGEAAQGLMVRRTRASLDKTIRRARQIYPKDGAKWIRSRSCFEWPSGACLSFRHLANDNDAELYQGHDYTRVYVEELTQFPKPEPVDKLKATLRSAEGAPCYFRATCNPGGPGHTWVKQRYIEAGTERVVEAIKNPLGGPDFETDRLFIPAKLKDNPALIARDPTYAMRLATSGSEMLVRAWLEGDWSVIMGAFFRGWSGRNCRTLRGSEALDAVPVLRLGPRRAVFRGLVGGGFGNGQFTFVSAAARRPGALSRVVWRWRRRQGARTDRDGGRPGHPRAAERRG